MHIVRVESFVVPSWSVMYFEYGNEAMDTMTAEEISACDHFIEKNGLTGNVVFQYSEETEFSISNDVTGHIGDETVKMTATWLE